MAEETKVTEDVKVESDAKAEATEKKKPGPKPKSQSSSTNSTSAASSSKEDVEAPTSTDTSNVKAKEAAKSKEAISHDWQNVSNLLIHKSPSGSSVAYKISGNIRIVDEIAGYKVVEYMKHGFGIVKGYTTSL